MNWRDEFKEWHALKYGVTPGAEQEFEIFHAGYLSGSAKAEIRGNERDALIAIISRYVSGLLENDVARAAAATREITEIYFATLRAKEPE